jgi:hypothetical protein
MSAIDRLRGECAKLGSSAVGGRPKRLLPSEEKELPQKYQALKADLQLLFSWAEKQDTKITIDMVGAWMCEQSRLRKLRVLLFWPNLHSKLPVICDGVRHRIRGGLAAAERTKDLLCGEYLVSPAALDRILRPS